MKNFMIIAAWVFIAGCSNKTAVQEKESATAISNTVVLTDAQFKNAGIETVTLSQKEMAVTLRVNGKIDVPPQNLISVSVPLGGYLRSTKLLPGMHVNKGEVLATMEDQQYVQLQQDYLLTKSKLHFAELEYQRQKELNLGQASSDKVMQQAEAETASLKIMMSALAEKLKLINVNPGRLTVNNISKSIQIYSSITGYVSKVNVNIGKYVNAADVLFELINPDDIHLNLMVFEKDVSKLAIGQKVMAFTNTDPAKKYPCEIILISKDIREEGTSEVHCHFELYDKILLPGTYMNAIVETQSGITNVLPEACLVSYQGGDYVFTSNEKNEFAMTEIKTGNKENGFIEILDAASLKDKAVVSKGAYTLLMAAKNKEEEE
jgi:membrane fusion protein, heavy metal efflux system